MNENSSNVSSSKKKRNKKKNKAMTEQHSGNEQQQDGFTHHNTSEEIDKVANDINEEKQKDICGNIPSEHNPMLRSVSFDTISKFVSSTLIEDSVDTDDHQTSQKSHDMISNKSSFSNTECPEIILPESLSQSLSCSPNIILSMEVVNNIVLEQIDFSEKNNKSEQNFIGIENRSNSAISISSQSTQFSAVPNVSPDYAPETYSMSDSPGTCNNNIQTLHHCNNPRRQYPNNDETNESPTSVSKRGKGFTAMLLAAFHLLTAKAQLLASPVIRWALHPILLCIEYLLWVVLLPTRIYLIVLTIIGDVILNTLSSNLPSFLQPLLKYLDVILQILDKLSVILQTAHLITNKIGI
jgi:hypothetical protein